jgi:hypothetical protein
MQYDLKEGETYIIHITWGIFDDENDEDYSKILGQVTIDPNTNAQDFKIIQAK